MYPEIGIMVPSFRKEAQAMQANAAPATVRSFHEMTYPDSLQESCVRVESWGDLPQMCFTEHEPGSWGPRRVIQAEIRESFRQGWHINNIRETGFDTNLGSRKCKAWLSSITLIDTGVVKGP